MKERIRGMRNRNPFNIRISNNNWKGKLPIEQNTDGQFEQFQSIELGIRAGLIILNTYYVKHKLQNIPEIIRRFAPDNENNTRDYIDYVQSQVLRNRRAFSNYQDFLCEIAKAILYYESNYAVSARWLKEIATKYNIFSQKET